MRKARARSPALGVAVLVAAMLTRSPAMAQGWWPWNNSEPERAPVPQEPVYRDPPPAQGEPPAMQPPPQSAPGAQAPQPQAQGAPAVTGRPRIPSACSSSSGWCRRAIARAACATALPAIENELHQVEQGYEQAQADLERYDCYEYFLFSKTLRRTKRCYDLAQLRDQNQRRASDLDAQRQQIASSSEQSYRDDIVRELARNNCGANYTQEARRNERSGDGSIWQDEDEGNFSNRWAPFGGGPRSSATYRTVCVRLCDGYYFPVSFSTLPSHFEQDATACQSKCAAPSELYYYQNPGEAMDQSISYRERQPYTSLKSAFRYRKELVRGCSCKEAEYVDPAAKRADGAATTGWEARSSTDAQKQ